MHDLLKDVSPEEQVALLKFKLETAEVDSAYIDELDREKISVVWDDENDRWICGGSTGRNWREAVVRWIVARAVATGVSG